MVVFTCNYCGDSLQKPKVEKHYNFVCRKIKNLTCVDCFKDFRGEEYAVHIKCCTEEERYAAKGAHPNGIVKKGDVKQESWLSQVRSIIEKETHLNPNQKRLLTAISQYDNIPRKKKKFINFLINSMGRRVNVGEIEAAWDIIEKHTNSSAAKEVSTNGTNDTKVAHRHTHTEETTKPNEECKSDATHDKQVDTKKKKRKQKEEDENASNNVEVDQKNEENIEIQSKKKKRKSKIETKETDVLENPTTIKDTAECQKGNTVEECKGNKFNIKETVISILERKGSITLKKLEKKVLAEYRKYYENDNCDRIIKKLHKKLEKMPFTVIENMVSLSSLTEAEQ